MDVLRHAHLLKESNFRANVNKKKREMLPLSLSFSLSFRCPRVRDFRYTLITTRVTPRVVKARKK